MVLQISAFAGDDALTLRYRGQRQPMMISISATHYDLVRLILVVSYWKAVLFQYVFTVSKLSFKLYRSLSVSWGQQAMHCLSHSVAQRYRCVTALYWRSPLPLVMICSVVNAAEVVMLSPGTSPVKRWWCQLADD
jgi:hypothetical protein